MCGESRFTTSRRRVVDSICYKLPTIVSGNDAGNDARNFTIGRSVGKYDNPYSTSARSLGIVPYWFGDGPSPTLITPCTSLHILTFRVLSSPFPSCGLIRATWIQSILLLLHKSDLTRCAGATSASPSIDRASDRISISNCVDGSAETDRLCPRQYVHR